jgi:hypothetical protein
MSEFEPNTTTPLSLCRTHMQKSNNSHFAEHNCDYCIALSDNEDMKVKIAELAAENKRNYRTAMSGIRDLVDEIADLEAEIVTLRAENTRLKDEYEPSVYYAPGWYWVTFSGTRQVVEKEEAAKCVLVHYMGEYIAVELDECTDVSLAQDPIDHS